MFKQIKNVFTKKKKNSDELLQLAQSVKDMSLPEKQNTLYGEAHIQQQILYEKWVARDVWNLKTEGVPLLCGLNPDEEGTETEANQEVVNLWQHAKECVNKNMLSIKNTELDEDKWEVSPSDLYCWATVSRVTVPAELSTLMEFVLQTVKLQSEPNNTTAVSSEDQRYMADRETVLGAALFYLVNHAEKCQTRKGKISSRNIIPLIMQDSGIWFNKNEPLLNAPAMEDLINQYIKQQIPSGN